jgi:hypothetical protein
MTKEKRTYNDLQSLHRKLKIEEQELLNKLEVVWKGKQFLFHIVQCRLFFFTTWTPLVFVFPSQEGDTFTQYKSDTDRHRRDDEYLVGLTTTYAISAYHHDRCDFEPR